MKTYGVTTPCSSRHCCSRISAKSILCESLRPSVPALIPASSAAVLAQVSFTIVKVPDFALSID